ncbi:MAG: beta-N-acetylhexosaminidase [Archangiaceae bacterium]|nr:beta-N-acetylhexosaminidase [Archangiaceae bacterium]
MWHAAPASLVTLLLFLLLSQVDAGPITADGGTPFVSKPTARRPLGRKVDEARVQRVFDSLSTREKAAQLVLAYPQIGKSTPVEVGGVLFVGASLKNVAAAKQRISSSLARAKVPPFFAVDMEGGPTNRLKSLKALREMPTARELATLDDAEVMAWGKKVGEAMRAIGLNLNLAPVFDMAESGHMADNRRSFGGDPEVVVAKATAYSRGLLEAGVVPIGKHYPGYGSLSGDSDHALVTAEWKEAEVKKHIAPFERAHEVLGGVMLANVIYSAYGPRPAIVTSALVEKTHAHEWLAVTDDISIKLLADAIGGTSEQVLEESFLAGNDLLLTTAPPDWDKGLDYIGVLTRLAERDPVAMEKLDAACHRVLRLKDRMKLLDGL